MTDALSKPSPITSAHDLAQLAAELGRAASSTQTQRAYASDFAGFSTWCRQNGHQSLPARPEVIGLYIAALFSRQPPVSISTIERNVAGIAFHHRLAGHGLDRQHPAIAKVLSGAKRKRRKAPDQKRPIISDELRRLLVICGEDLAGLRNRTMLLIGFYGALRGSELVSIEVEHLTESPAGYRLRIPFSKGDQEGEGQFIGLPRQSDKDLCPVRAMKAWLIAADIETGPVFVRFNKAGKPEIFGNHLTDAGWRLILKGLAKKAGFSSEEVRDISGHSLRAGHITTGYMKDVPEHALQKQARHQDPKTTRRYNRQATVFIDNSAKRLMD